MSKRLVRKLTDVVAEVERQLKAHFNITQKDIDAWRQRARALGYTFPESSTAAIDDLWIDYEVQRDVLHKHIINIARKWDPRVCSPGSACCINDDLRVYLYDAQHRTIAAALLGYTEIPCAVVRTDDPNFASYAFELLNEMTQRLTPGDLHRNALVRYKNGSWELRNVQARKLQDQFDAAGIDLQDKSARNSDNLRGDNDYFFSHFKYAYKAMEVDKSGRTLLAILTAIRDTFPLQEEIDQGVFIGLCEIYRIAKSCNIDLPRDWMRTLLGSIKSTFKSSSLIHAKAKVQWEHRNPGAAWSAPQAMANFLRELHVRAGGTLDLPYHGEGSRLGVIEGDLAPGLIPTAQEVV